MTNNKQTQVVDFSNPNADKIISGSTQQKTMSNNKQSSVNHNPNNVQIGDYCILDNNTHPVKVFSMTEKKLFSQVGYYSTPIDTWHVMTNRLKPLKFNNEQQ